MRNDKENIIVNKTLIFFSKSNF